MMATGHHVDLVLDDTLQANQSMNKTCRASLCTDSASTPFCQVVLLVHACATVFLQLSAEGQVFCFC